MFSSAMKRGTPFFVETIKRRDIRIHFFRNRTQLNEVGMIDGKTIF